MIFSRLLRPWIRRFTTRSTILVAQRRFSHTPALCLWSIQLSTTMTTTKRHTKYAKHPLALLPAVVLTVHVASLVSGCFLDAGFTSSIFDWKQPYSGRRKIHRPCFKYIYSAAHRNFPGSLGVYKPYSFTARLMTQASSVIYSLIPSTNVQHLYIISNTFYFVEVLL